MAPQIGHDGQKRTVTFGSDADGPTEGAYRTARLWARIGTVLFGVPAAILTVISAVMMVDLATDLAETWAQVLKFSAIAFALSLASTGLPAWAGLIEASNPDEARAMRAAWLGLLTVAAFAMIFFVLRLDPHATSSPSSSARASDLRASLRTLAPVEWDAWNASNGCTAPPARWRSACDAVNERRARAWAELQAIETGASGWSPAALIGSGQISNVSGFARRALAALLTLLAMAGAGILARWGALGHAEAMRQADGIMPAPRASASVSAGGPPALISPLKSTDLWFKGRVREDSEGRLNPTDAFEDYLRICAANAQPPITRGNFFNFLAAKAKASDGKIFRGKASSNHYHGWTLGEEDKGALPGDGGEMLTLPYRS